MRGELQALRFAAGERGGGLAEAQIAEADFVEDAQLAMTLGTLTKKCQRFAHGHAALRGYSCRGSGLRGRCS